MPLTLADIDKGHEFPPATFDLSAEWVSAYNAATQSAFSTPDTVPPMGVAALSIRALLESARLPPGSIHAAQELAFHRAARIGEVVVVNARVVGRGERAEWVLMSVALDASIGGKSLMTGRATVSFPLDSST